MGLFDSGFVVLSSWAFRFRIGFRCRSYWVHAVSSHITQAEARQGLGLEPGCSQAPVFRCFCPCPTSVRSGKRKLEGNKLRLSQSLADIARSSIGQKFGVILRQPRLPSQTAPTNRTDDVWSSGVIRAEKSYHLIYSSPVVRGSSWAIFYSGLCVVIRFAFYLRAFLTSSYSVASLVCLVPVEMLIRPIVPCTSHTGCMLITTVVLCTIEASCRNGSSRSECLPQSGTMLCILKEKVREVWRLTNGEMCEMSWFSFLIAYPKTVFWNWSQLPVVAWHFQFSMLAVQSRIATSPLSRNDGPLRHIWACTCGHCVGHRVLRCTTPSAASGASLHHFGYRCVPPPCGTTAPPKSGAPFSQD